MPPILEPFQFEFFIKGLVAATLAGGLCGLIGVYIVLRGMAYIGHGLSHAVFGGAVVSYVMSINFFVGASIWGFLSALLITLTTRKKVIGADAAIGIVTTASFALGVAIISTQRTFSRSFEAALIGDILGVERGDLVALAAVSIGTVLLVLLGYKLILFTTFDPEVARFYGVPTAWVDTAFSLVLAGVIVVSMQILGVTMIAAAIVIPPIVARLITNKFSHMLLLSTAIGAFCGFFGIYISYWADVSSGATIVLFAAALFLLAMAWSTFWRRLPFSRRPRPPTATPGL